MKALKIIGCVVGLGLFSSPIAAVAHELTCPASISYNAQTNSWAGADGTGWHFVKWGPGMKKAPGQDFTARLLYDTSYVADQSSIVAAPAPTYQNQCVYGSDQPFARVTFAHDGVLYPAKYHGHSLPATGAWQETITGYPEYSCAASNGSQCGFDWA